MTCDSRRTWGLPRCVVGPVNAREVIARSNGICKYSWTRAIPHDHNECLIEADKVLESLAAAGYQVTGVTTLPDLEGATR